MLDHYLFFCTLTYNNESLPRKVCSNGLSIPYADVSDLQKMFKRIRHSNLFTRPFKYFFVTERGKGKGRPHIHGLIFIPKYSDDDKLYPSLIEFKIRNVLFQEWKRNYGSDKYPVWKPLFTYRTKYVAGRRYSNFDCHYVVPHSTEKGADDVAFYVTKYVLKPSTKEKRLQQALKLNLDKDEYEEVWQVVRSRCISSNGFGAATDLQKDYVKDCIERSKNNPNGLQFFASDGLPSPLSRYYRRFVSSDAAISSVAASHGPIYCDDRSFQDKLKSIENGERIVSEVDNRDISEFFISD